MKMELEESPENFKCIQYSNDDTDSEFDATDSENDSTSEWDEEECDKRKNEHINEMIDLERQFVALKEQLYLEKLTQVDKRLEEVKAGIAQEYLSPVDELQNNMKVRTKVAGVLREFRFTNIRCQYEAEIIASNQNLESEKNLLREEIRQDLEEKIRRLEEDRNSVDSDVWNDSNYNFKKKKRRGSNGSNSYYEVGPSRDQLHLPDRRRKPVPVSGPFIVYMLRDNEILDDWAQIKRACKSANSLTYYNT